MNPCPFFDNSHQKQLTSKEWLEMVENMKHSSTSVISAKNSATDESLKLSRAELREVSQNISLYYAPKQPLSGRKLVLLPVDPEHIYLYWNLVDIESGESFQDMRDQELKLSIYSHSKDNQKTVKKIVETTIQNAQSSHQITLPFVQSSGFYSATLSQYLPEKESVELVKSNLINASYGSKQISEDNNGSHTLLNFLEDTNNLAENTISGKSHYASCINSGQRNQRN